MSVVLASLLVILSAGGAASASAGIATPEIRIAATQPLTVVGTHFRPGSRVRVDVSGGLRRLKFATVDRRGSFRATFAASRIGRCAAPTIVVVTSAGTRRLTKRLPAPDCPPPA